VLDFPHWLVSRLGESKQFDPISPWPVEHDQSSISIGCR
jgi:hypothetical protein